MLALNLKSALPANLYDEYESRHHFISRWRWACNSLIYQISILSKKVLLAHLYVSTNLRATVRNAHERVAVLLRSWPLSLISQWNSFYKGLAIPPRLYHPTKGFTSKTFFSLSWKAVEVQIYSLCSNVTRSLKSAGCGRMVLLVKNEDLFLCREESRIRAC